MDEREFKKLLIDLDLSLTEIGDQIGLGRWAVTLYFRGALKNRDRRAQIRAVLRSRATELGVDLPEFWEEAS